MENGNTPAHPTGNNQTGTGLTKREYFAAMAMHGYILSTTGNSHNTEHIAKLCVAQADALLTQLDKK